MSLQTIEMHFREVLQLSEQLSGLAKMLKIIGENDMMQIISDGKKNWNSECADILAGKEVKLGMQLISEADAILKIAEEMKKRAEKMYQAEMINNSLAAVRVYL